jgi:hypothetical protein
MICSKCKRENPENSKFCSYCGVKMSSACSSTYEVAKTDDYNVEKSNATTKKPGHTEKIEIVARCPYCGSVSLQASKKGFSLGKAVVGGVLLGPVGLLGGTVGSNKFLRVCLNCGKKF